MDQILTKIKNVLRWQIILICSAVISIYLIPVIDNYLSKASTNSSSFLIGFVGGGIVLSVIGVFLIFIPIHGVLSLHKAYKFSKLLKSNENNRPADNKYIFYIAMLGILEICLFLVLRFTDLIKL
jgi:hypothetical protein